MVIYPSRVLSNKKWWVISLLYIEVKWLVIPDMLLINKTVNVTWSNMIDYYIEYKLWCDSGIDYTWMPYNDIKFICRISGQMSNM